MNTALIRGARLMVVLTLTVAASLADETSDVSSVPIADLHHLVSNGTTVSGTMSMQGMMWDTSI